MNFHFVHIHFAQTYNARIFYRKASHTWHHKSYCWLFVHCKFFFVVLLLHGNIVHVASQPHASIKIRTSSFSTCLFNAILHTKSTRFSLTLTPYAFFLLLKKIRLSSVANLELRTQRNLLILFKTHRRTQPLRV